MKVKCTVVLNLREACCKGTSFIQTPVNGGAQTGGLGIPKHHPIGMITPANGDTGEGLKFEIGACLGTGTLEVADGPKLK